MDKDESRAAHVRAIMEATKYHLRIGNFDACEKVIAHSEKVIDSLRASGLGNVDAQVSASFYLVASEFNKVWLPINGGSIREILPHFTRIRCRIWRASQSIQSHGKRDLEERRIWQRLHFSATPYTTLAIWYFLCLIAASASDTGHAEGGRVCVAKGAAVCLQSR